MGGQRGQRARARGQCRAYNQPGQGFCLIQPGRRYHLWQSLLREPVLLRTVPYILRGLPRDRRVHVHELLRHGQHPVRALAQRHLRPHHSGGANPDLRVGQHRDIRLKRCAELHHIAIEPLQLDPAAEPERVRDCGFHNRQLDHVCGKRVGGYNIVRSGGGEGALGDLFAEPLHRHIHRVNRHQQKHETTLLGQRHFTNTADHPVLRAGRGGAAGVGLSLREPRRPSRYRPPKHGHKCAYFAAQRRLYTDTAQGHARHTDRDLHRGG
mmetsp:Transcript_15486/g.34177  ORF Transcript_15486/g.34177 Transcript_15486/m.34177 type:complete len:267 (+) Transcript_15486:1-801(+)